MVVPIGVEDEDEAIYFTGDSYKQQLSDLIIACNALHL
jgi:hypothetical protein